MDKRNAPRTHVSLREVAAAAGLGVTTVSDILNPDKAGRYNADTVRRVRAVTKRLNYVPNRAAQLMRRKRSQTLGFILTRDFKNPFFARLAHAAQIEARRRGFLLETVVCDGDTGTEAECVRQMENQQVEGIVIGPLYESVDFTAYDTLLRVRRPVVTLGGANDPRWDDINQDWRAGWRKLIGHLHDLGHRRLAFLGIPPKRPDTEGGTIDVVRAELERRDLIRTAEFVCRPDTGRLDEAHAQAMEYLKAWRNRSAGRRATAMLCMNDQKAMTALSAASILGIDIPGELSVSGWDNLPESEYWIPPLTTVDDFMGRQMAMAVDRLLERIDHPDAPRTSLRVEPELVRRASTGPCPG